MTVVIPLMTPERMQALLTRVIVTASRCKPLEVMRLGLQSCDIRPQGLRMGRVVTQQSTAIKTHS